MGGCFRVAPPPPQASGRLTAHLREPPQERHAPAPAPQSVGGVCCGPRSYVPCAPWCSGGCFRASSTTTRSGTPHESRRVGDGRTARVLASPRSRLERTVTLP